MHYTISSYHKIEINIQETIIYDFKYFHNCIVCDNWSYSKTLPKLNHRYKVSILFLPAKFHALYWSNKDKIRHDSRYQMSLTYLHTLENKHNY